MQKAFQSEGFFYIVNQSMLSMVDASTKPFSIKVGWITKQLISP